MTWAQVAVEAAGVTDEFEWPLTLGQVHHELARRQLIPDTKSAHRRLSSVLSGPRACGEVYIAGPAFRPQRRLSWLSADDARRWLSEHFALDPTEGQEWAVYLATDHVPLVEVLDQWFGPLGVTSFAVDGYQPSTFVDGLAQDVWSRDGSKPVLLWAGALSPTGEDIQRDLVERANCFEVVERVAVTAAQARTIDLPRRRVPRKDPRAAAYAHRHRNVGTVDLAAFPPRLLRDVLTAAVNQYVDRDKLRAQAERQEHERRLLFVGEVGRSEADGRMAIPSGESSWH